MSGRMSCYERRKVKNGELRAGHMEDYYCISIRYTVVGCFLLLA